MLFLFQTKYMCKYIFLLIFLIISRVSYTQKQEITLEKAILGGGQLAPTSWSNIQWAKNENTLFYSKRGAFIYKYNPSKNTTDSIPFINNVNAKLKGLGVEELKNVGAFIVGDNNKINFSSGNKNLSYDLKTNLIEMSTTGPDKVDNTDRSPEGNIYAYTKEMSLYIMTADGKENLVAKGNDSIVVGKSVHREEFGIQKGTFWSPKGNYLAFYRMDQSMVSKYPILDMSVTPAVNNYIYYPMAGGKSHHVTLGIYDLSSGKTIYLETGGDPEHYLTNVSWSPDEKEIYIAEINRDQDVATFNAYNPLRGNKIRNLYTENSRQYTEPLTPYVFIPAQNKLLLAQSKRDGWNSIYLYTNEGELVRQLTKNIEVTDILGFDHKNKFVYFQGILPNSIDVHGFQTEISSGKTIQLTQGAGLHNLKVSFDGKYTFESHSAFGMDGKYVVNDLKSNKATKIFTSTDPLSNFNLGKTTIDTLYSKDNTTLFARTIFPVDFDPAKKYPVVVYVYGGPHAQMIRNSRLAQAQLWMYTLANKGYIVFTLDNRGSGNRGMRFENGTHRNLGELEMEDQMKGYDFLLTKNYVDSKRIGVHGWSYGGFMTISLMTRQPGKFKAAVAGGPVTDWNLYEIMYTERYMDSPSQNPDGYAKASTFKYIDNLNGPMMLIHGTADDVVVWQHSLNYIQACISKGKQVDYFVYPGHKHNVLGKDRVHLIRKIMDYFDANL